MTHDILVVGGGLVGSCIAGFLAAEGARVVLLDDGRTGGSNANAGSLHVQMQSRFMRLYPENVPGMERQLPLYPQAVRFWQAFEKELGADFELKVSGGLMVAETVDQLRFLAAKAERERSLGLDVELLDRDALRTLAPALSRDLVGAELCRDEGKLNPLAVNAAVRRWGRMAGVDRRDGVRVSGLSRGGGGFVAIPGDAGYTLGPLSARAVADAVLGHDPAIDLSDYSPDRFAA